MPPTISKPAPHGYSYLAQSIASRRGLAIFLAAVYCAFAPMGVLVDMAKTEGELSWRGVLASSVFCGFIAVGWAYAFTRNRLLLFVVVPVQFLLPPALDWAGILPSTVSRYDVRLSLEAGVCVLAIIAAYVLFLVFIQREATATLRLKAELAIAGRIHAGLVPELTTRTSDIEVFGRSIAGSEMGGDLIDLIERPDGTDLIIADVSGHGVGAGVVMGMVKSAIRARLVHRLPLEQLLTDLNTILSGLVEPGMFVTLAALRVPREGPIQIALAGHPPVLRVPAGGGAVERIAAPSMPLCVSGSEVFSSERLDCGRGDLLVLYTDGITEVLDAQNRQLGLDSLKRAVAGCSGKPLAETYQSIMDLAASHGPAGDDQTVMLIRIGEPRRGM